MKKILLSMCAIVLVAGMASSGYAATLFLDFPITVSIVSDPIDLDGVTAGVSFGNVNLSSDTFSNLDAGQPRSTFNNLGYATLDYRLQASAAGNSGNAVTLGAAVADNTCVLSAIFTVPLPVRELVNGGADLDASYFEANDILTGTPQTATDNVFASDSWSNTLTVKGNGVISGQPNSPRSVRYRLQAPSAMTTADADQTFTVNVTAIAL